MTESRIGIMGKMKPGTFSTIRRPNLKCTSRWYSGTILKKNDIAASFRLRPQRRVFGYQHVVAQPLRKKPRRPLGSSLGAESARLAGPDSITGGQISAGQVSPPASERPSGRPIWDTRQHGNIRCLRLVAHRYSFVQTGVSWLKYTRWGANPLSRCHKCGCGPGAPLVGLCWSGRTDSNRRPFAWEAEGGRPISGQLLTS